MRVLLWHVHGGWTDALVRGRHEYLMPTTAARDAWGLGAGGRDWPRAIEVAPDRLRDAELDAVILQRPDELAVAERLTGRRLGRDLAAVYVEHNTPRVDVADARHPMADRDDLVLAHVTHFNALFWDGGRTRSTVVEHGIRDPGALYTGTLDALAAVVNEPVRRWRVTGTDLLPRFAALAPVDVFGMGAERLPDALPGSAVRAAGDLRTAALHAAMAERRLYLHPARWTSLGLSLLEAMHLGMPVVALGTTEAFRAVPPDAGAVSTDLGELLAATRGLLEHPDRARAAGRVAREAALARYGLPRFLADWDELLDAEVTRIRRHRRAAGGGEAEEAVLRQPPRGTGANLPSIAL